MLRIPSAVYLVLDCMLFIANLCQAGPLELECQLLLCPLSLVVSLTAKMKRISLGTQQNEERVAVLSECQAYTSSGLHSIPSKAEIVLYRR